MKTTTTTTATIADAQIALSQGKIVKTQFQGKEVRVLRLIPGMYGFGWQMKWNHLTVERATTSDIMEDATFTVYA